MAGWGAPLGPHWFFVWCWLRPCNCKWERWVYSIIFHTHNEKRKEAKNITAFFRWCSEFIVRQFFSRFCWSWIILQLVWHLNHAGNPAPQKRDFHKRQFFPRFEVGRKTSSWSQHGTDQGPSGRRMDLSEDRFLHGGFLKWWVSPTTMGFPILKIIILGGGDWGYQHFRNPPHTSF